MESGVARIFRSPNVQLSKKVKVLLDFFQKIVGFQRAKPLVAFRRKRNLYALRAFRVANEVKRRDFAIENP